MKTTTRRDRLLNLLRRQATTVPTVAEALGVSDRTIYRDIAALREAGHDIQATSGPGGGVRIAPDDRPRPVRFEVDEVVGLALSVAILRATPHLPFARSAQAGLDRARLALSAEKRRAIRRLERRILVGAPSSEPVRRSVGPVDDRVLSVFEVCFTSSRSMAFEYVDAADQASSRSIECIALVLNPPAWYILAWDLDKDACRLFRMDRIAAPTSGEPLLHRHSLDQVLPQVDPELDRWSRQPIG